MIDLDLRISEPVWSERIPDLNSICQDALNAAATEQGATGEVSVLLTDDTEIQALNKQWRAKDKPTDVLSFPADPMDTPFLGDIAIALGVTQSDAKTRNLTLPQHLSHLLIHGLLHLLGYDHKDDTEAAEMEAMEIVALASLGWPDPYV